MFPLPSYRLAILSNFFQDYVSYRLSQCLSLSLAIKVEKAMASHSSTVAWKIPWMEEPGSLRPWGRWGSDTTSLSLSRIGEGNGNPLQCSCLGNPREGGALWAAICGVTQSQTRLKRLSSGSSFDSKASACNAGDPDSIRGSGRSPGEGSGNPLQYSCLEDFIDRGAWRATVHGVAKSWTQLSE